MDFDKVVGIDPSFPNKQYALAIYELLDRYLVPRAQRILKMEQSNTSRASADDVSGKKVFNPGFEALYEYSMIHSIPLTIYLHAERTELENGYYNSDGQGIIQFAKDRGINLIMDLTNGLELRDFRDDIHINNSGQKRIASLVVEHWN
jgi:hypothetical protein